MSKLPAAIAAVALTLAPVALAGCGSSNAANTDTTAIPNDLGEVVDLTGKAAVSIDVVDNSYNPKAFKVSPGTKITYVNKGLNVHNVTPSTDGTFEAISLTAGQSGTVIAPQNPKTYGFYCTIHGGISSGQRGAIVVVPPI
jgi:plastocyanin